MFSASPHDRYRISSPMKTPAGGIPRDRFDAMDEDRRNRRMPKFASKDNIHIVVAGAEAGKFSGVFHGWAGGEIGSIPVSRKIED